MADPVDVRSGDRITPPHSRAVKCQSCATLIDRYRSDDWLHHDGVPTFSEREVFRFDRADTGRCDLCGEHDARGITIDVWRLDARRSDPADQVLALTLCARHSSPNRWSPDDWRWFLSGAYGAHAGAT
jgi:hypothetical protein